MKQKIFIVLTVLCMAGIFIFSGRVGEVSTEDSHRVGMAVGEIVVEDFDNWSYAEKLAFAIKVDHPIRKMAHASEYALLAFLTFGAVGNVALKKRFFYAQAICSLYAVSDEIHQLFVPGRDGNAKDVLIDSCGAVRMLILIYLIIRFIKNKTNLLNGDRQ